MSTLSKQRLETLTDGIVAIIFTLMVLEIKRPSDNDIMPVIPYLIGYALSALVVGIMWLNHHNMFHLVEKVDTKIIWLNFHLLFWMSLIPLPTGSLGKDPHSIFAAQFYAIILIGNSIAYTLLNLQANNLMKKTVTSKAKRKYNITNIISIGIYVLAFFGAYLSVYIAYSLFIVVPVLYFSGSLYLKYAG
jgi:uncharacterized membrane protein